MRAREVPFAPRWPLCMDAEEFALWEEANRRAGMSMRVTSPCDECPLGFALEMRAVGRCDGEPGGIEEDEEAA